MLHAEAWNPNVFPEDPPHLSAGDLVPGARVVVDVEGLPPGRVLADIVQMQFGRGTTPVQRQASLDAIRGTVVGASAPSETEDRTYFVRLPADSMREPILVLLAEAGGLSLPNGIQAIALDSLLAPEFRRAGLYFAPMTGCASLRVRLSGSSAGAESAPGPSCGPIVPQLAGPLTYDVSAHAVHIPIRVANNWRREVAGPLRVLAWNERITDIAPAPSCGRSARVSHGESCPPWNGPEGGRVPLVGFDSTIGAGASEFASALIWRVDATAGTRHGPALLPAESASAARVITMTLIDTTVREFTIQLRALAENEHPVPLLAPHNGDPENAFVAARRVEIPAPGTIAGARRPH